MEELEPGKLPFKTRLLMPLRIRWMTVVAKLRVHEEYERIRREGG